MKHIFTIIIFLSFTAVSLPNLALAYECAIVDTSSTSLNIRSNSSNRSRRIAKAYKGSALRILSSRGVWTKVLLNNGRVGYAHNDYISPSSNRCSVVSIKSGTLNVRSRATKRSAIIGRASKDSTLRTLKRLGDWTKVLLNNGRVGYVNSYYIY